MKVPNIDLSTGIHYGIISMNDCSDDFNDFLEPLDTPLHCPGCGNEVDINMPGTCPHCGEELDDDSFSEEATVLGLDTKDLKYSLDDYNDVWVFKSPYYVLCGECSPCAPNAGHIVTAGSLKTYCLPPEAYTTKPEIYSVETGEKVL